MHPKTILEELQETQAELARAVETVAQILRLFVDGDADMEDHDGTEDGCEACFVLTKARKMGR